MLTIDKLDGKWPSLAPTKNNLEEANIQPFKPPKVDNATDTGMIHWKIPSVRSLKVTATAFDAKTSSSVNTAK